MPERPQNDPEGAEPYAASRAHAGGTDPYAHLTAWMRRGRGGAVPGPAPAPDDQRSPGGGDPATSSGTGAVAAARGGPAAPSPAPSPTAPHDAGRYGSFYEPGDGDFEPSARRGRRARGRRAATSARPSRGARRRRAKKFGPAPAGQAPTEKTPGAPGTGPAPALEVRRPGAATAAATGPAARPDRRATGRRAWFLVAGIVVLGIVVAAVQALPDGDDQAPTAAPAPTGPLPAVTLGPAPAPLAAPTAVAPLPGELPVSATVDDGPVRVDVLGVTTGVDRLEGLVASAEAEGEFVVVRLAVTAREDMTFLDTDHRLVDAGGTQHEPDAAAGAAVDGNDLWFARLDPSESAQGVVVFDVPAGTAPQAFLVRGDGTGPGARVELPTG